MYFESICFILHFTFRNTFILHSAIFLIDYCLQRNNVKMYKNCIFNTRAWVMMGKGLNCGKQKSCPLQAKALLWTGTSPSALASFTSTDFFFPLAWLPLAPSVVRCGRNDCSARVEQWFGAGRTTEGIKGTWGVVLSHPLEEPDSTSEETRRQCLCGLTAEPEEPNEGTKKSFILYRFSR